MRDALKAQQYANGGKMPTEILRSRLESHMSPQEADSYLEQYGNGGYTVTGSNDEGKTGMMKARMALDAHFGNPAAKRMVSANPKTGMTPEGIGTHYMTSMGNYAVPLLQDFGGANLRLVDGMTPSKEDMRFESPEDAEYFAQHYKEIAPMMRNFLNIKDYLIIQVISIMT